MPSDAPDKHSLRDNNYILIYVSCMSAWASSKNPVAKHFYKRLKSQVYKNHRYIRRLLGKREDTHQDVIE